MKKIYLIFFLVFVGVIVINPLVFAQTEHRFIGNTEFIIVDNQNFNNGNTIDIQKINSPLEVMAPTNDDCASATNLTIDAALTCGQTATDATLQGGECYNNYAGITESSVWYRFTSSNDSLILNFIKTNITDCSPELRVFGPFTPGGGCLPACSDTVFTKVLNGDPGAHILLTGLATSGNNDYLIQIQNNECGGPDDAYVNFCINISNPDANNNASGSDILNSCGTGFSGTTNGGYWNNGSGVRGANLDGNSGTTCGGCTAGDDVPFVINNVAWFSFCSGTAGTWNITLNGIAGCQLSAPNAGIQASIFTGTTSALVNQGNSGSPQTPGSSWTSPNITVNSGQCGYIMIDGFAGDACNYTVTLTNVTGGCITTCTGPTLTTSQTNINCNGAGNGTATANASGGTTPYTYSWNTSPAQTTATATGLSAATYSVTVSGGGCSSVSSVTITEPAILTAGISAQTNVACNGNSTGSATVTAGGGTTGYSYNWSTSPAQTTATATGLSATSYTVTVTDANSCTKTASVTITQPAVLTAGITAQTNVLCSGATTGSATVTAGGGATGYSYNWSTTPAQTAATATGLSATSYTVTVTDANSCTKTASVTITQPAVLTASITAQTNVLCSGGTTGSATVTAGGGATGYTYNWNTSPAQTGATATGLSATSYIVTVTDANSCTKTASVTITQPAVLTAGISAQTNVLCSGATTGSATVTAGGGATGYTYNWNTSPAQTSATATGLSATSFTVTVTDANSCTQTASVTITQPAVLTAGISAQTNVLCSGGTTGSATVTAGGGATGYTYNWNTTPVQTSATATGLSATSYSVTVTDANSCTKTASVTITQPAVLTAGISSQTNVLCSGGATGSATVTAGGGATGYTYNWNTTPAQTSATATGLSATSYSVTVTDANSCTKTASVTITQPAVLTASITAQTNVLCFGGTTGSSTVTAGGGATGYTYNWNTSPAQTGATATGLSATSYTVTVTDANSCTKTASVTITQPAALTANITAQTNVLCSGATTGSSTVTAGGGATGYTYNWNTTPGQTSATATGLSATSYSVTVTDANSCTKTASVTITQPAVLTASISAQTNILCSGGTTGNATVTAGGGATDYTYNWNTSPAQTSATATGLSAISYTVTVTDANSCTTSSNVTITEPAVISLSTSSTDPICGASNGSATVTPSGGTSGYTYLWNTSPAQTDSTASGLAAGTYSVTVTDNNGCSKTASEGISNAGGPTATIVSSANVVCNGASNGNAVVNGSGGTTPYSYSWNTSPVQTDSNAVNLPAGNYVVQITDAGACVTTASVTISEPSAISLSTSQLNDSCSGGNNGTATVSASGGGTSYTYEWSDAFSQITPTATGLSAATYTVTVTDNNSCSSTSSVTITEPSLLSVSSLADSVSCNSGNNGQATASVTGGTTPYSYLWNNGQTSAIATGLIANTYSVTITDSKGCTATSSSTVYEPAVLNASATADSVLCNGGSDGQGTASGSGGTSPYNFNWSNGQTSATTTGLFPGPYSVTVSDSKGCSSITSITVSEPVVLAASVTPDSISCFGGNDGQATVNGTGGTSPYSFLWNNAQITATATGLSSNTFNVTLTDGNGCTTSASTTISEPSAISLVTSQLNDSCNGGNNGSATVSPSGGGTSYSYLWSANAGSQISATATGLGAATYTVTVTDNNSCSSTSSVTITEPSLLSVSSLADSVSCNSGNNGQATASVSGGITPYSYLWDNGQTSAIATGLAASTYSVTITDLKGCTASASSTVYEPAVLNSSALADSVLCNGGSDGQGIASGSGGTSPYYFNWSNGQTTATTTGLLPGSYSVTVSDSKGCSSVTSITVSEPVALASLVSSDSVSCFGGSNGQATASGTGGTSPYSFLWNNGQTTSTATGLSSNTFNVTLSDINGCSTIASVNVDGPADIVVSTTSSDAFCSGISNGEASVSASGGSSPFSYLWTGGQTSVIATGLSSGIYYVTVTDANGCVKIDSATVNEPGQLMLSTSSVDALCFGSADGMASVLASGGGTSYTYAWTGGQTSQTATGLAAGIYNTTVTDNNGCSEIDTVTVNEPTAIIVSTLSDSTLCFGDSTGSATATVSGGISPYYYLWDDSTGQITATVTGLTAGIYNVTITDDNNCTLTSSATISQPAPIISTIVTADANCSSADGSASASPAGGTAPYSYLWSNAQTGSTATALTAAIYYLTITDANNCSQTTSATVSNVGGFSASISSVNAICNGYSDGTATASPSGGNSPITYLWDNLAMNQISQTATGLASGTYSVTISDNLNCLFVASVTIDQPAVLTTATTTTDILCFGDTTGTATVTAIGGTSPYYYLWQNGQISATSTGLSGGTYQVTVTDNNSCVATSGAIVNSPASLSSTPTATNETCGNSNGSVNANVIGGTTPYSYLWSNGQTGAIATGLSAGTYSVTITDFNLCETTSSLSVGGTSAVLVTVTANNVSCNAANDGNASALGSGGATPYSYLWTGGQITQTATGLSAGNYLVSITDAAGCSDTASVFVTEPSAISASLTSTPVSCNGDTNGNAVISASGGTSPYAYLWNNSQTDSSSTGLSAGVAAVTLTDANNCTLVLSVTITEPAMLNVSVIPSSTTCGINNGTVTANVNGGTSPYTYIWNTGDLTQSINSLAPASYSVTITDSSGCTRIDSAIVLSSVSPAVTATSSDVLCNGDTTGTALAIVTGGTPPYLYNWSTSPVQTSPSATGLTAGTYSVSVADSNNCVTIDSVSVTEPAPIIASINSVQNVSCNGSQNGQATATGSGGISPYTYSWSNSSQTSSTATGLSGGIATVTIMDANGCTAIQSVTISEPAILSVSTSTDVPCGATTGGATANSSGGTSPYSYSWSNGQITATATSLIAGNYSVTVTDINGCTKTGSVSINFFPIPAVTTSNDTTIFQESVVNINAVASGGAPPFSYLWSTVPAETNATISVSPEETTTYYVTVTNAASCSKIDSVTIKVNNKYIIFVPSMFSPNNDGHNDLLYVRGLGIKEINFVIFDRWGEQVYNSGQIAWTGDETIYWDGKFKGKDLNSAVFVYVLNAILDDGNPVERKGNITLVK